jgi:hypothetical protein
MYVVVLKHPRNQKMLHNTLCVACHDRKIGESIAAINLPVIYQPIYIYNFSVELSWNKTSCRPYSMWRKGWFLCHTGDTPMMRSAMRPARPKFVSPFPFDIRYSSDTKEPIEWETMYVEPSRARALLITNWPPLDMKYWSLVIWYIAINLIIRWGLDEQLLEHTGT